MKAGVSMIAACGYRAFMYRMVWHSGLASPLEAQGDEA
jgi:hypothetical protein